MINRMKTDIIKGVFYDRGYATHNEQTKYITLVAMIVASEEPLTPANHTELVVMGECSISEELKKLVQYDMPCKLGDISEAVCHISSMSPEDLDLLGEGYNNY